MKTDLERIVQAVLYEGYMLYPYRKSALKNQHRWNFGVVYPDGTSPSRMSTECLIEAEAGASLDIEVRFLQVESSHSEAEPVERRIPVSFQLRDRSYEVPFAFGVVAGVVTIDSTTIEDSLIKVRVQIVNRTLLKTTCDILSLSLISTHTILKVRLGRFVSLLEPPEQFAAAASSCSNVETWPVLVGAASDRDCMLSSPIILYDYPQVAPESPGDFFDATEIDEMLALRVATLAESEKEEIRRGDERSRRILERAEALTPAQLQALHGRTQMDRTPSPPFSRGNRVRLKPKPGGDVFDVVLAGRIAIVESVEEDLENRLHVAVVIEDDPGIDLGFMRQPGHRFFFSPDEMEIAS